jgi:hypothetical protein
MANSVQKNPQGPLWPLGNIVLVTPGIPVSIMSLVDPTSLQAPETPTTYGGGVQEYTVRAQQITFEAFKAGATPPRFAFNAGNIYIVQKPTAAGGGAGDVGTVLWILTPGGSWNLGSSARNNNVYSPYELFIDGDTAGDGCQVTLNIA